MQPHEDPIIRRYMNAEELEEADWADAHPVPHAFDDLFQVQDGEPKFGERWPRVREGEREPLRESLRTLILRRDRYTCGICGQESGRLEVDHIVPWSAGGEDISTNLRTLCHHCNQERSNYRWLEQPRPLVATWGCDDCYGDHGLEADIPTRAWCGGCGKVSNVSDPRRLS